MTDEDVEDDGPDDGPADAADAAPGAAGPEGERRRRRRRRRRRGRGDGNDAPEGVAAAPAAGDAQPARERRNYEQVHGPRTEGAPGDAAADAPADPSARPDDTRPRDERPRDRERGRRDRNRRDDAAPREGATGADSTREPRGENADGGGTSADAGRAADANVDANRDGRGGRERVRRERGRDRGGRERDARSGDTRGGERGGEQRGGEQRGGEQRGGERGGEQRGGGGEQRGGEQRGGEQRGGERGGDRGRGDRGRDRGGNGVRGERAARDTGDGARRDAGGVSTESQRTPPVARLEQRRPSDRMAAEDSDDAPHEPTTAWGTDDDGPPAAVTLAADLPPEPLDDDDPLTKPLEDTASAQLGDVIGACGVRFVPGGRVSWFDCGDADWALGDRVLVDTERGSRLGWIAAAPIRRPAGRDRMRRVIRRANEHDLRGEREGEADRARVLRVAKDKAAQLRLPLKVFRVELSGQLGRGAKLNVYYTSDDRLDLRDFIRDVGNEIGGARIELRQLGVRDEAKAVGGIGSCGLTLCCTTWLPDFVPVSIKMAKDQGLVLSPTKVSGQCGRLKCCLVYEQSAYAELRKGLPKLGKRVIGARGEGRIVEVDVLRQRVRVSYGPGDTEVVPAGEVKPLFPSGNQPAMGRQDRPDRHAPPDVQDGEADDQALETDDPSALARLRPEAPIVDEPPPPLDDEPPGPTDDLGDLADVPDLPDSDPSRDPNADD